MSIPPNKRMSVLYAKPLALAGVCFLLVPFTFGADGAHKGEADSAPSKPTFEYQKGPIVAPIGDQATIGVDAKHIYISKENVPKFLELTENIPDGDELAIIGPPELGWFAVYFFDDVGYIKDDEKSSLDAAAMLKQKREATESANEELKRRGWPTMTIVGWTREPYYDPSTHNLEWSVEAKSSDGGFSINHDARVLGRRGVMRVRLVAGRSNYSQALSDFRLVNKSLSFTQGNDYGSWVKGDKVAEYGLTALVVGGIGAAAAKTGLLKTVGKLLIASWKLVLAGLVAFGGMLKRLFTRKAAESPSNDGATPQSEA